MICCSFVFKPGVYDADFHRLDSDIAAFARSLPGFVKVENWQSADGKLVNANYFFEDRQSLGALARYPTHREAKSQVDRWYEGYKIVVSEVTATYGDGRIE